MGFMDLFSSKNDKELEKDMVRMKSSAIPIESNPIEPKYIWVEGYKGTDKNMSCTYTCYGFYSISTRHYTQQYILNGCVTFEDIPITGEKGFHFCTDLEEVFTWYPYNFSHRYFKVKALVREDEWEQNGGKGKFAAKSIILTEEIISAFEDLAKYNDEYKEYMFDAPYEGDYLPISKEMFETLKQGAVVNLDALWKQMFFSSMRQFGYSELFTQILFDRSVEYSKQKEVKKVAKALHEETVSGDIAVYLLMKELDR